MTEAGRVYQVTRSFEGVIPNMERRYRETDSNWIREEFERYQNNRSCGTCGGYRLRAEALAVKIAGLHAGQVVQMSIKEAFEWCKSVPDQAEQTKAGHRRAHLKGNSRKAWVPEQCRARISHFGAQFWHTFGWRKPTDSPCKSDRFWAAGRALCA